MTNIRYMLQKPNRTVHEDLKNNCEMFQAESVRDAAFGCDWVGSPLPFQLCLIFIIATANKSFQLTAGKFVPVSNVTMMNVGKINILCLFHESSAAIGSEHPLC